MPRIDLGFVGELEKSPKRCVKGLGSRSEFILVEFGQREVNPSYVTDEQGVAGQHEPVVDQHTNVLGSVARGVDDPHVPVTDVDHFAVDEWFEPESHVRPLAQTRGPIDAFGEFTRGGGMVGMYMGVQNVGDREAVSLRRGRILGDVALRIDDRCDAPTGAADEVGGTGALLV